MRTRCAAALAAALVLSGCSSLSGDLYADTSDLARAQAVWSDTWAAPTRLTVASGGYGSNDQVNRRVGTRTTTYALGSTTQVATSEIADAAAAGWSLTGVDCSGDVHAVLVRDHDDLDSAAAADLTVTAAGSVVEATVEVAVPHHVDEQWPDLGSALQVAATCLTGGASGGVAEVPLTGAPLGPVDDDVDAPAWSDDGPGAEDDARADALRADPWFASTGAALPDPDHAGGDRSRSAPSAHGGLEPGPTDPTAAVAAVVASMDGWELTWTSCGARGDAAATLRLAGDPGPVTARLVSSADAGGGVDWQVTLPVVGGPDQSWVDEVPTLERSRCGAGSSAPRRRVSEGTPVGLPTGLQPVA